MEGVSFIRPLCQLTWNLPSCIETSLLGFHVNLKGVALSFARFTCQQLQGIFRSSMFVQGTTGRLHTEPGDPTSCSLGKSDLVGLAHSGSQEAGWTAEKKITQWDWGPFQRLWLQHCPSSFPLCYVSKTTEDMFALYGCNGYIASGWEVSNCLFHSVQVTGSIHRWLGCGRETSAGFSRSRRWPTRAPIPGDVGRV